MIYYYKQLLDGVFVISGIVMAEADNTNHKSVKPWSQDWLVAAGAYPGFGSMKRLGVFLLPPGQDASPSQVTSLQFVRLPQQFADIHLYSWVERGAVRVKCLVQEHNTVSGQGLNPDRSIQEQAH